jgi:hypothetical protein
MRFSRLSLYYLFSYLLLTGVAFLVAPHWSTQLLMARQVYSEPFVQFVGAFMIALGILVVQIVRHRLEVLYPTTLFVRAFFIVVIVYLYIQTRDPLFLTILAVVSLGVALTTIGLLRDRKISQEMR